MAKVNKVLTVTVIICMVAFISSSSIAEAQTTSEQITVYEENSPNITYTGSWATWAQGQGGSQYSGGFAKANGQYLGGGSATFTFTGTGVKWFSNATGIPYSGTGVAKVYLDGALVATVDLRTFTWTGPSQAVYTATGLANTSHTLKVENKQFCSYWFCWYQWILLDKFEITAPAVDITAPNISIDQPSGTIPAGGTVNVIFTATDNESNVTGATAWIDGARAGGNIYVNLTRGEGNVFTGSVDAVALLCGERTLTAEATNDATPPLTGTAEVKFNVYALTPLDLMSVAEYGYGKGWLTQEGRSKLIQTLLKAQESFIEGKYDKVLKKMEKFIREAMAAEFYTPSGIDIGFQQQLLDCANAFVNFWQGKPCTVAFKELTPTIVTNEVVSNANDKIDYSLTVSSNIANIKEVTIQLLDGNTVLDFSGPITFKKARNTASILTSAYVKEPNAKALTVPSTVKDKATLTFKVNVLLDNGQPCSETKDIIVNVSAVKIARVLSTETVGTDSGYEAVGSTMLNRIKFAQTLKSKGFSDNDINDILTQGRDFSASALKIPSKGTLEEKLVEIAYSGAYAPKGVTTLANTTQKSREVAVEAIKDKVTDPTKGALYFYAVGAKGGIVDILKKLEKCSLVEDAGTFGKGKGGKGGNKFFRPVYSNLSLQNILDCYK